MNTVIEEIAVAVGVLMLAASVIASPFILFH